MIKHFSKWLKMVPLSNHSNEGVTYAFFNKILNRFGALAKVIIDQGTKFYGEFQKVCEKAVIYHRLTSQDHHEVDMLTEQMLQMMKQGLLKYGFHKGRDSPPSSLMDSLQV
jgi:transposase-like protein